MPRTADASGDIPRNPSKGSPRRQQPSKLARVTIRRSSALPPRSAHCGVREQARQVEQLSATWPPSLAKEALSELLAIVAANVPAIRVERGVSEEAFAKAIGVHRTYMGGIGRGERNLRLGSLERLAGRLGVDALELLSAKG